MSNSPPLQTVSTPGNSSLNGTSTDKIEEGFDRLSLSKVSEDTPKEVWSVDGSKDYSWRLLIPTNDANSSSNTMRENAESAAQKQASRVWERKMGGTEVSYYLGSRGKGIEGGVNDMYLHIGFQAPRELITQSRILEIWTELTSRHNLLVSEVNFQGLEDIWFRWSEMSSYEERAARAEKLLEFKSGVDRKDILDTYLNGPRTLSDSALSGLVISTPASSFHSPSSVPLSAEGSEHQEFNVFLYSTHFIGDGIALHRTLNEFFTLLGDTPTEQNLTTDIVTSVAPLADSTNSANRPPTRTAIESSKDRGTTQEKSTTPTERVAEEVSKAVVEGKLAKALEGCLERPDNWGRLAWTGAKVDFQTSQSKLIGGQSFPRRSTKMTRRTLVPTISYSPSETKQILTVCKSHQTTIANTIFSLVNIAWIRACEKNAGMGSRINAGKLPGMIYSAMNVRGLLGESEKTDWYRIAIGYYNIILPTFIPRSLTPTQTFWLRTSQTKLQTSKIMKSKLLGSRTLLMGLEREKRSIGFEREDERRAAEKARVDSDKKVALSDTDMRAEKENTSVVALDSKGATFEKEEKTPSVALMGVSMLGNLDALYSHKLFPSLTLHTLTTGSRQRPSSILLFSYTFAGKLWFSLGYDADGFQEGFVEGWWGEVKRGVEEFLLV